MVAYFADAAARKVEHANVKVLANEVTSFGFRPLASIKRWPANTVTLIDKVQNIQCYGHISECPSTLRSVYNACPGLTTKR